MLIGRELAAGFHSIGLIFRDWFRIGFIWGSRPKLPILSISKGLVKHWHFRPILSQSALSGIGWLALDWKKGEYFTLGLLPGLHKLWYPVGRDMSTWSKFGAHGEHGDVFLFPNLGAL